MEKNRSHFSNFADSLALILDNNDRAIKIKIDK